MAIDLFSGVGGLSLGFEQAGFDVVASVEYDPVHAAVHAFNFPLTEIICDDVSKVDPTQLLAAARIGFDAHGRDPKTWTGEIDVVFGGPPCQGFSTMGKREVGDQRNRLVYAFAALVAAIQPRYFVMENVPGMVAGGHAGILARLVARIRTSGYEVLQPYRILNTADYGVPQDRRRLILLGWRGDQHALQYPSPSVRRTPKRSVGLDKQLRVVELLPAGPTVADAILDLPDLDNYDALLESDEVELEKEAFQRISCVASEYARRLRGDLDDPDDLSHPRIWDPSLLTSSMRTVHTQESVRRFRATICGETEPISRFYRLDPLGLSNTLRAGTGSERGAFTSPRPIHPTLPRVLSVREAARLHSFPDWFRLHQTKWHGFRSIGNAVPPLLGRVIGRVLVKALGISPEKPSTSIVLGDTRLLRVNRLEGANYFGANIGRIPKGRKR